MNNQNLREMKRYLRAKNSAGGCMLVAAGIIGIGAAAGAIACYISCILSSDTTNLLPAILLTILALIFSLLLAFPRIQASREQKNWIETGRLEEMVADFEKAACPPDSSDLVRLGDVWIFGRGCGRPVEYVHIRKLQVQTLKNNAMPLETTLFAILDSGMSIPVCREIRKSHAGSPITVTKKVIMGKMSNVQEALPKQKTL